MATTTTDISINNASWTEIAGEAGSAVSGFFSLSGDSAVIFRQGTSAPANTVVTGHWLEPASDSINFSLLSGEKAYALAKEPISTIIITLDG